MRSYKRPPYLHPQAASIEGQDHDQRKGTRKVWKGPKAVHFLEQTPTNKEGHTTTRRGGMMERTRAASVFEMETKEKIVAPPALLTHADMQQQLLSLTLPDQEAFDRPRAISTNPQMDKPDTNLRKLRKTMSFPSKYDISNDFDISPKRIGEGASCIVYSGVHRSSGTQVAVKQVPESHLLKEPALLKEVSILSRLRHPNVVGLVAASPHKQHLAVVMEILSGENLFDWVCDHHGPISEDVTKNVVRQLLRALQHLHERNIIHRDIKLENAMWSDDQRSTLKLIDFGLAAHVGELKQIEAPMNGQSLGTLGYKSPEVLNECKYGPWSDCWSVGVLTC
ncbi:protein kinase D1-like, partial [Planoprotostelium fungivorum]